MIDKKERQENEKLLRQQAAEKLQQNNFTTIPTITRTFLPATSNMRSRFNFGKNKTRMTSVTLFDINAQNIEPKPQEPTDEELLNHNIAQITRLPFDDFDEENPLGHNLGMDEDPEDRIAPQAQVGPQDAIRLPPEEYSETEEDFLTNT